MIAQKILHNKYIFALITTLFVAAHIAYEYLTGEVTTHHLLADENLPGISNWWGLLSIPLLTIITITITQKLHQKKYFQIPLLL